MTKLGLDGTLYEDCTIVLEEDGTTVDDVEVLVEYSQKTFILLTTNQAWEPAGTPADGTLHANVTPTNSPGNKYFLMDKNVNKGFSTEFDSVGPCKNTHKTPLKSSLGKASFSGKIQNGRH